MKTKALPLVLVSSLVGAAAPAQAQPPAPTAPPAEAAPPVDVQPHFEQRSLTLEQVLEHALGHAPDVQVSEAMVSLGVAQELGAKVLLPDNPVASVGLGGRVNPRGNHFELQAQLSQSIWIAGQRRLRRQAAKAARELRESQVEQTRWQTYAEVHAAFNRALLARHRLQTARELADFSQQVLDVAKVQLNAGEISVLNLRLAEVAVAEADQAVLAAQQLYRAASLELARLAGWPEGIGIEPAASLPEPVRVRDVEALVAHALEKHPELEAGQAAITAAEAAKRSAKREAWPNPSLGVSFAREQEPGTPFATYITLGVVSVPIPFWQRNQRERAEANARLNIARTQLHVSRYRLSQRIRQHADAINTAAQRLQAFTTNVTARWSENLELLRRSYELGESGLLDVFVARERFVQAQQQALDIYGQYFESLRELELASGHPISRRSSPDNPPG